jgi:hypothetical protein
MGKEITLGGHETITLETPVKQDINVCVEGNCSIIVSLPYFDRKYIVSVGKSGAVRLKKASN